MQKGKKYKKVDSSLMPLSRQNISVHANLKAFLLSRKVPFEFLEKQATKHAMEASKATGIPLSNFAKTLILVNEMGMPFVAVLRADMDINRHLLQRATGFKSVNTAPVQLAEKTSGFPTGGIPPIGHRKKMLVFIDKSVLKLENVWCGGGSRAKIVKLRVQDILKLSNPAVSSFAILKPKK